MTSHLGHAIGVEHGGVHHSSDSWQQQVKLVNLVEYRLFILLEVTGVGQWQTLKGSHETGKITNETPCLAAGKFSDVRVLFFAA